MSAHDIIRLNGEAAAAHLQSEEYKSMQRKAVAMRNAVGAHAGSSIERRKQQRIHQRLKSAVAAGQVAARAQAAEKQKMESLLRSIGGDAAAPRQIAPR